MVLTKVVSLARSADRRADFDKEAARVGLDFEYVDAVDGPSLSADELSGLVNETAVSRNLGRRLSAPEIGCAESHHRLYAALLTSAEPGFVILEDDVTLSQEFSLVARFLGDHAREFERERWVFFLGGREGFEHRTLVLSRRTRLRVNGALKFRKALVSHHALLRTCAYFVTRGAAESILSAEPKICQVPDPWDFRLDKGTLSAAWFLDRAVAFHPLELSGSLLESERSVLENLPAAVDQRSPLRRTLSRWRASARSTIRRKLLYPLLAVLR